MIKGAKKQMIVLRTGNSRYFDEAYFVLRREWEVDREGGDILSEANRILSENTVPQRKHSFFHRPLPCFFAGLGLGLGMAAIPLLILLI